MSSNVPVLTIGPTGPVVPDESAILAGCMADIQAAFGGDLSEDLTTPQGQLATSNAVVVGNVYGMIVELIAGMDPATSDGRMQDGIAKLYFLERKPAQGTVVILTCTGKTDTFIPINAKARDRAGNLYLCIQSGTIPAGGSIDLAFVCEKTGPIACPVGFVNAIYQGISGWDSVTNNADGVIGNDTETRGDFEYRRAQSVAIGGTCQTGAIFGAILALPGVLDGYALENPLGQTSGASFVGSIADNVLTVTELDDGELDTGQLVLGATQGTMITGFLTGAGGVGTYTVSIRQTVASRALQSAPGGVRMKPNSIVAVAYGGNAAAIGAAILRKKNPGCNYNGNTTVLVQDTNPAYETGPSYRVTYLVPTPTPIKFAVSIQNGANIPSSAVTLIRAAIITAFTGADGKGKARVAGRVFASRYYSGIAALGDWALIYEILVGIDAPTEKSIMLRLDQIPTITASDIAVTFD